MKNRKQLKKLGKIVREFRKEVGVTQEVFAKLCMVSQSFLSKVENGDADVPFSFFRTFFSMLRRTRSIDIQTKVWDLFI